MKHFKLIPTGNQPFPVRSDPCKLAFAESNKDSGTALSNFHPRVTAVRVSSFYPLTRKKGEPLQLSENTQGRLAKGR